MRVYLGLGANIGNREGNLLAAVRCLRREGHVVAVSSLYRSTAIVIEGDPPGPDFLNAVCEFDTNQSPSELLRFVKSIEWEVGRRPAGRWAPRPIDIDVLLYGDQVLETAELVVPHPCITERNFVLLPLAELASGVMHPKLGVAIGELAEAAAYEGLEHVAGPEWAAF